MDNKKIITTMKIILGMMTIMKGIYTNMRVKPTQSLGVAKNTFPVELIPLIDDPLWMNWMKSKEILSTTRN